LTERCNLRCKKCTIWKSVKEEREPELSKEEIFSLLSQLSSVGTKIIALWGGGNHSLIKICVKSSGKFTVLR